MRSLLGRAGTEDTIAWLMLGVIGLGVFVTSFGYGVLVDGGEIGPGFLPMVSGGLLAAQSIALLWRSLHRSASTEHAGDVIGADATQEHRLAGEFDTAAEATTDTEADSVTESATDTASGAATDSVTGTTTEATTDTEADSVTDSATDDDVDRFGRTPRQRIRMLWAVFGILVLGVLLVNLVGFIVAFGLVVFAISAGIERRSLLTSLLIAVIAVTVIYLIFVLFLAVPLPTGLVGLGASG